MALSTAQRVATLRGMTAKFDIGMQQSQPFYPELCTIVQSTGADEKYGFLGAMPAMTEWVGDRAFKSLRAADYTLINREFEASLAIEKNAIEDDRLGMYDSVMEDLGRQAAHHPDKLLLELITNAESLPCYDGQYFFDTDHSWGNSGTQSNDLTYNASDHTAVTEDEFRAAYHAARAAMLQFKNDEGELFIQPTVRPLEKLVLAVPVGLELVANKAINKDLTNGGETNIVLDKPKIVSLGGLASSVKFYLFNVGQSLKPFVFQARRPLQRQMKGMDDREFRNVKFMADARYNLGYLAWWNAVLTTFN